MLHFLDIIDLTAKKSPEVPFDCNFWYSFTPNPQESQIPPSDICEAASFDVADYLVKNQKFIVELRQKIVIVGDPVINNNADDLYDSDNDEPELEDYESE